MRSFKQYLLENLSSSESSTVPQGVLIYGNHIIVGVRHGEDLNIRNKELLRLIQSHGQKHGYYFEGRGGPSDIKIPVLGLNSKGDYRGGWDENRLNRLKEKGIQPHHLSILFGNVDVNWKHGISDIADDKSSIFDGIHRWANSKVSPFSGIEISKKHIRSFLEAMSPGTDRNWLRDAQETRASPDAVKKFLKDAEKIAWPAEWSTKPRSTGLEQLVDRESEERNSHIIDNMPRGVFIAGAGHLLQIRDMLKDRGLREGEREGEFQFHGGENIEP